VNSESERIAKPHATDVHCIGFSLITAPVTFCTEERERKQYLFGGGLHLSLNETLQPHHTSSHFEKMKKKKGLGGNVTCSAARSSKKH